ncbi:hypothetical protein GCM10007940_22850 [Portibacter lacus]|uniref:DUF3575 domain-containing protein n=2 Tax=Portibacter lacus TaxID=1099794 RepID=A0AA37WG48_9BACT|nr:hypothetical protein GCM10007940_22850 [Portibacter lacus]
MTMKKQLTFYFLFLFISGLYAQPGVEFHLGGSNFLGWSMNGSYKLIIIDELDLSITPSLGVGSMIFPEYGLDAIVHTGVDLQYKKWGIGGEISHFFANPFLTDSHINEFIALLVYPNVSYLMQFKNHVFLEFSVGVYFAYENRNAFIANGPRYQFAGDVIPGVGITFGYRFR